MSNELPDDLYELKCQKCKEDILFSQYKKTIKKFPYGLCEECSKEEIESPF